MVLIRTQLDLKKNILFILAIFIAGCSSNDTRASLYQIFSDSREFMLNEDPVKATYSGINSNNHRMPSMKMEDLNRRLQFWKSIIDRIEKINFNSLSKEDQTNYKLFQRVIQSRINSINYKDYQMPLNADSGFHTGLSRLHKAMPFINEKDYLNYISRLNEFPRFFNEYVLLMKEGIKEGRTLPQVVLNGYEVTISTHVVNDPEESVFFEPFKSIPSTLSKQKQEELIDKGKKAIMGSVVPSFQSFLSFFLDDYYPNSRKTIGAYDLPNGKEFYQYKINHFTTLNLNPEQIHNIGLAEVKRIRIEMENVISEVGFKGSFLEFLDFLRTDPQFYADTPEELLKEASFIAKKMDAKLPLLFKTLPRLPYGVAPVPDDLAPKYTGGRYVGPGKGSIEPGYYWVNTYKLDVRPLYNLEALTLHEGVPGHHLQNSISAELENVPEFRKELGLSVYGEGWGLYSEFLGLEAGFYKNPYSNFGRLTYEMWRACRLVVDTGIHAMGWSRQKVINYLSNNTALPIHECITETDRYIAWPGQALAYKIGELKIKELRNYATMNLGDQFDIREFHDAILWDGELPLDLLEENIKNWVSEKK